MLGGHLGALRSQQDHLGFSRFFSNFSAGFALAHRPPTTLLEKVTYVQKADKRRQKLKKLRTGFKRFLAFIFSQIGLSLLVVGYTVLGGLLFRAVELEHEKMVKIKGKEMRDGLADKFSSEILRQLRYQLLSYDTQTNSYYKFPKLKPQTAEDEQIEEASSRLQATKSAGTIRNRRISSDKSHQRVRRSCQQVQFARTRRWLSLIDYTLRRKMRQELHSSLRKLVKLMEQEGWNGEDSPDDLKWSWEGSILFAVTVITTIGYGHAVPKTNLGKLLTIGYALIGIPLVFLYLSNIGDYLATLFRTLYARICRKCCEGNCLKSNQLKNADTSLVIWNAQSAEMEDEELCDQNNPGTHLRSNLRILKRIGTTKTNPDEQTKSASEMDNCTTLVRNNSIHDERRNDCVITGAAALELTLRKEPEDEITPKTHTDESKVQNTLSLQNDESESYNVLEDSPARSGDFLRKQQLPSDFGLHNSGTQTILHADPLDALTSKSLLKSFATCRYLLCYRRERRQRRKRYRRRTLHQAADMRTCRGPLSAYAGSDYSASGKTAEPPPIPLITSCPTFSVHPEDYDEKIPRPLNNPENENTSISFCQGQRKLHSVSSGENDMFLELNHVCAGSPVTDKASFPSNTDISGQTNFIEKTTGNPKPAHHQSIRKLKMNARSSGSLRNCQQKTTNESRCRYSNDLDRSRLSILASMASSTSDMRFQVSYYSRDSLQSFRRSDGEVRDLKASNVSQEDISNVTVPISLSISIMTTYILIGAIVFCIWEDDNYLKWSYFCFVTLSTIGFGDIVPGTKVDSTNPQEKLIIITLYVAIGLSVFAMCFKLMQEEVVSKCKWLGHKIGLLKHRVKKQKLNLPQPRDNMTATPV